MTPYLDDGDVRLYHGNALDVLASLDAGSVQTCITSPPYWGLRDYGTGTWQGGADDCDHTQPTTMNVGFNERYHGEGVGVGDRKQETRAVRPYLAECGRCGATRTDSQIGLEPTPDQYVAQLVAVFREVWRVLKDDGTAWLNLGDSYAAGVGRNDLDEVNLARRAAKYGSGTGAGTGPRGGRGQTFSHPTKPKDLVGIPWRVAFALQADGWYLRSDIIWAKPNPMPESVTDRPTKAHEYLFLLSKQPRYFYDAQAIAEVSPTGETRSHLGKRPISARHEHMQANGMHGKSDTLRVYDRATRNKRSVWEIATQPTPDAHFATFPEALVRPCILAGSRDGDTVLDPFVGSGTTAVVARKHGRCAVGVDLNAEYLGIAARRLSQQSLFAGVAVVENDQHGQREDTP